MNAEKLKQETDAIDAKHQNNVLAHELDVTKRSQVKSCLENVKSHFGKINGLVNYAGTGGRALGFDNIWETSDDEFDFIVQCNVRGAFNILSEVLKPGVLEEPGSSVVHISSMFAERGFKKGAVFSASKHASIGMVKSAALEVGSRGIRVNNVMPGPIDTPMHQRNLDRGLAAPGGNIPLVRDGKPEEVASVVCLLLSDECGYVTGATWTVDGGANA
ncbi:hypothetical protein TRVA0_015S02212 [Trichomonascus vanleenenianus]|uniref:SDR family NAD(P)-dependent oxidoreductase n=1 Tax=Trichomonascus vanleenenianus TaxID=2268995 RepID=UPI003ECA51D4